MNKYVAVGCIEFLKLAIFLLLALIWPAFKNLAKKGHTRYLFKIFRGNTLRNNAYITLYTKYSIISEYLSGLFVCKRAFELRLSQKKPMQIISLCIFKI